MKSLLNRKTSHSLSNITLTLEIGAIIDLLLAIFNINMRIILFFSSLLIIHLILNYIIPIPNKHKLRIILALPIILISGGVLIYLPWKLTSTTLQYEEVDFGKSDIYSNQTIMAIVPHEDDEINIAGGIFEQYIKYGSDVYVVFVTNGDYYGLGETRIQEAINTCEYLGITKDHVIFLGYGDKWDPNGPHIYNADSGQAVISAAGYTHTYGIESHPAYHEGNLYTKDNLFADMKNLILEYHPDTILCSDYDAHVDHKATTLMFEKVMGEILKENPDYSPTVLKAYAYNTAWRARSDYYTNNILSTENIFVSPYNQTPQIYTWDNRIRLPIAAETISRSLVNSNAYAALEIHASQDADKLASSITNGDKVFWWRKTDSILYTASINATSGEASLLNDFMLIDTINVLDSEHLPYDGTWIPEKDDSKKCITITFPTPKDIYEISLYDNPSSEDNVLNAIIAFDNREIFETGNLSATGSESNFIVDQTNVQSFTITISQTEGEKAGLTEIEAYNNRKQAHPFSFIKLMDGSENFIYDYILDKAGNELFQLYEFGTTLPEFSSDNYTISCDNEICTAEIYNNRISVTCPRGESCVISITCNSNPDITDSVVIRNPNIFSRMLISYTQKIEQTVYDCYRNNTLHRTVFYRTFNTLRSIIQ